MMIQPDLQVLGEAPGRPGLFLAFGHGHFGMTGGPPRVGSSPA